LARGATGLLAVLLERLGFSQAQAWIFEEIALHAATSLALLAMVLALHALVFSLLRRRRDKQHDERGNENLWVLILDAAGGPLRFAFWVCGLYAGALPLLVLLEPDHAAYPVRLLIEKIFALGLFAASYWLLYRFVGSAQNRFQRGSGAPAGGFQDSIVDFVGRTLRVVISIAAIISALPLLGLPPIHDHVAAKTISLLIVGAIAWVLFHLVEVGERFMLARYSMAVADNLRARQVSTQVHILKKTLQVIIAVFALASGLMVFDQVRSLGASVLASAGVLSIIIGFAAQRTIANLFAGFQLALTQPIRLDDVVIVENEWGRIEEITLTYVVVRIWDMRRLIVPLSFSKTVSKLDPRPRRHFRRGLYSRRLLDSCRCRARRAETGCRRVPPLGRPSLRVTSDQRDGANRRAARAGERGRRRQRLGFALRDPRETTPSCRKIPECLPRLRRVEPAHGWPGRDDLRESYGFFALQGVRRARSVASPALAASYGRPRSCYCFKNNRL
jgi:small-conductance mechanosensitive channel